MLNANNTSRFSKIISSRQETGFGRFELQRLMKTVAQYDIGSNPALEAIFDPLPQEGFNIWCTPDDNPGGDWLEVAKHMDAGAFSKSCAYVACMYGEWENGGIAKWVLTSDAYDLSDHISKYRGFKNNSRIPKIHNRPADLVWAKAKTEWMFAQAGLPCPTLVVER